MNKAKQNNFHIFNEYNSAWLMIGKQMSKCLIAKNDNINEAWPPSRQGEG